MSTLQQQQQQQHNNSTPTSLLKVLHAAAQQLRFLSCATGSTAALRFPRATAHGGRTAAPIALQSQWRVQEEGKTEGERVLLLNKWRWGAASRCQSLSVEKCKITKGCGPTLGCNRMMQTIRTCISLTLCLTLSPLERTSQRAQCATVMAMSAAVLLRLASGPHASRWHGRVMIIIHDG